MAINIIPFVKLAQQYKYYIMVQGPSIAKAIANKKCTLKMNTIMSYYSTKAKPFVVYGIIGGSTRRAGADCAAVLVKYLKDIIP